MNGSEIKWDSLDLHFFFFTKAMHVLVVRKTTIGTFNYTLMANNKTEYSNLLNDKQEATCATAALRSDFNRSVFGVWRCADTSSGVRVMNSDAKSSQKNKAIRFKNSSVKFKVHSQTLPSPTNLVNNCRWISTISVNSRVVPIPMPVPTIGSTFYPKVPVSYSL